MTINGVKFKEPRENFEDKILYDMNLSTKDLGLTADFYRKVITAKNPKTNKSPLEVWSNLAYYILSSNKDNYWDHDNKGWEKGYGKDGYYFDLVARLSDLNSKKSGNDVCYKSTGLQKADSLKDVEMYTGEILAEVIGKKTNGNDFVKASNLKSLHDRDQKQDVLYTVVANKNRYGKTFKYGYTACGIAFYNFKICPVSPDALECSLPAKVRENRSNEESDAQNFVYCSTNKTTKDASASNKLSLSSEVSATTSISNSKSVAFGQMIGVEIGIPKISKVFPDIKLSVELSYEQVLSTAYSEEKTITKSSLNEKDMGITVSPHTIVKVLQNPKTKDIVVNYDCPVVIQFDVAVFSKCGCLYSDNAAIKDFNYTHRSFTTLFSGEKDAISQSAADNLYIRYFNDKVWSDKNDEFYAITEGTTKSVEWNKTKELTKCVEDIVKYYPANTLGAVMSFHVNEIESTIDSIIPIYTLDHLCINKGKDIITLKKGEKIYLDDIQVEGFDKDDIPFYGFNRKNGMWSLENQAIVTIERDQVLNKSYLKAQEQGKTILKYDISDVYSYYDQGMGKCKSIKKPVNEASTKIYVEVI